MKLEFLEPVCKADEAALKIAFERRDEQEFPLPVEKYKPTLLTNIEEVKTDIMYNRLFGCQPPKFQIHE